jgi:small subunit ribosomal protein S20
MMAEGAAGGSDSKLMTGGVVLGCKYGRAPNGRLSPAPSPVILCRLGLADDGRLPCAVTRFQSHWFERLRTLANNKSSKKRILINETKRLRNRPYRSAARTYVKKAEIAIKAGDKDAAATAVGEALSMLDRVAGKGIIHSNNAARRKSRLMKKYNALSAAA